MRQSSILVSAAALLATAKASPLQALSLAPRAGAPVAEPIPKTCNITDPLDHCNPTNRYKPSDAANSTILYSYFLQPDSVAVTSSNSSALFQQCLETCSGYGNTGDCRSAYLAYEYPMPPEFGLPGGNDVVACLMWGRPVVRGDFVVVPAGTGGYGNSTAGSISCPA